MGDFIVTVLLSAPVERVSDPVSSIFTILLGSNLRPVKHKPGTNQQCLLEHWPKTSGCLSYICRTTFVPRPPKRLFRNVLIQNYRTGACLRWRSAGSWSGLDLTKRHIISNTRLTHTSFLSADVTSKNKTVKFLIDMKCKQKNLTNREKTNNSLSVF